MNSNKTSFLYHPSLDLLWQSDHWTINPHSTIQTLGRLNCLSSHNSTVPLRTTLAIQQSFQPSSFLCCYTKQAIHVHKTFALFFCTILFSFHAGIFFPTCATKVILDAESKSANSSRHSQGMPRNIHKTVLFKDAAVSLSRWKHTVYRVRIFYLIRLANNIFTVSPKRRSNLQIHASDNAPSSTLDISFYTCTVTIIYSKWCVQWLSSSGSTGTVSGSDSLERA